MSEKNDKFYRDQWFKQLDERLIGIETSQISMQKDINIIKSKMSYTFGMVAGVTVAVNVAWQWIRSQFTNK